MNYFLSCVSCKKNYHGDEIIYRCTECSEILEVVRIDIQALKEIISTKLFTTRWKSNTFPYQSGVWRYRELILPIADKFIISKPEGNTNLYFVGAKTNTGGIKIGKYVGLDNIYLKHEGENPTGSFKDRGMTVGISVAKMLGMIAVACASTGNTSSSLASYASYAGMKCFVFLPKGKISNSKLAQSIAYGAYNIVIGGDFDEAMRLVQDICKEYGIYLLNSINPFRIEGQKTILLELLQQLDWKVPDWIILPGGNLGNTAAIGKGLLELRNLDLITRLPRIAVIQASGANPFYQSYKNGFKTRVVIKANTIASAIRIGNPVSYQRAQKIIKKTNGIVEQVTDQEILDAKAIIDSSGIGCEPASAATIAGLKKLIAEKIIKRSDKVVGVLTGHILKDPDTVLQYHSGSIPGTTNQYAHKVIEVNIKDLGKKIKSLL